MSNLNKILISLILLLTFSCSLSENNNTTKETGEVSITIPSISPRFLQSLKGESSRAYNFIDKLELIISKEDADDVTVNKDFTISENKEIVLILEAGEYTIKANIFNLNNSDTVPVVTGEGDVTVSTDYPTDLFITLRPYQPVELAEGVEINLTEIKHSEYVQYIASEYREEWYVDEYGYLQFREELLDAFKQEPVISGQEFWYKIKTSTDATDFAITNPIENFSPAILTVYNTDGTYLDATTLINQKISIRTTPDTEYFISVVPVKVKNDNGDFYKDTVSFKYSANTEEDKDGNTSKETAKELTIRDLDIRADFNSFIDVDYYKLELKKGQVLLSRDINSTKVEVIDSTGSFELNYEYTAIEDGFIYLKLRNNKDSKYDYAGVYLELVTPIEYMNKFLTIIDNWKPNYNAESSLTDSINIDTKELTVTYDMSSENNIEYPYAEMQCFFNNFSLSGVNSITIGYKSDKDIRFSLPDGAEDFSAYCYILPASTEYRTVTLSWDDYSLYWGTERSLDISKVQAVRFDAIDQTSPGEYTINALYFE